MRIFKKTCTSDVLIPGILDKIDSLARCVEILEKKNAALLTHLNLYATYQPAFPARFIVKSNY